MIAAVFVLVLALVIGVSSLMGGGAAVQVSQSVPWWALMAVVLAVVAFFAGGVYMGAVGAGSASYPRCRLAHGGEGGGGRREKASGATSGTSRSGMPLQARGRDRATMHCQTCASARTG